MKTQNQNGSKVNQGSTGAQKQTNKTGDQSGAIQTNKETFTPESYERLKEGAKNGGENSHGSSQTNAKEKIDQSKIPDSQNQSEQEQTIQGNKIVQGINTPGGETFSPDSYERLKEGARKGGTNSHKNK